MVTVCFLNQVSHTSTRNQEAFMSVVSDQELDLTKRGSCIFPKVEDVLMIDMS